MHMELYYILESSTIVFVSRNYFFLVPSDSLGQGPQKMDEVLRIGILWLFLSKRLKRISSSKL